MNAESKRGIAPNEATQLDGKPSEPKSGPDVRSTSSDQAEVGQFGSPTDSPESGKGGQTSDPISTKNLPGNATKPYVCTVVRMSVEATFIESRTVQLEVGARLARGTFSEVMCAKHTPSGREFALKLEKKDAAVPMLHYEYEVYDALRPGTPGFAVAYALLDCPAKQSGLLITRLGPSLQKLFEMNKSGFSAQAVAMIGVQCLQRLQALHEAGYVHRDIKPDNFVISDLEPRLIHLVDFGLARRFYKADGKTIVRKTNNNKLSGTPRYVSINCHEGITAGRRDDIESLMYMLIYLIKGKLPWMNVEDTNRTRKHASIHRIKKETTIAQLCTGLPKAFASILTLVREMSYEDLPDYNRICDLLWSSTPDGNWSNKFPSEPMRKFVFPWTVNKLLFPQYFNMAAVEDMWASASKLTAQVTSSSAQPSSAQPSSAQPSPAQPSSAQHAATGKSSAPTVTVPTTVPWANSLQPLPPPAHMATAVPSRQTLPLYPGVTRNNAQPLPPYPTTQVQGKNPELLMPRSSRVPPAAPVSSLPAQRESKDQSVLLADKLAPVVNSDLIRDYQKRVDLLSSELRRAYFHVCEHASTPFFIPPQLSQFYTKLLTDGTQEPLALIPPPVNAQVKRKAQDMGGNDDNGAPTAFSKALPSKQPRADVDELEADN